MMNIVFSISSSRGSLAPLPQGRKFNGTHFDDEILERICINGRNGTRKRPIKSALLQMDSCKIRNSRLTGMTINDLWSIWLAEPRYSPDIAPCDFWPFGWSNTM
jgi:hypothetical protein